MSQLKRRGFLGALASIGAAVFGWRTSEVPEIPDPPPPPPPRGEIRAGLAVVNMGDLLPVYVHGHVLAGVVGAFTVQVEVSHRADIDRGEVDVEFEAQPRLALYLVTEQADGFLRLPWDPCPDCPVYRSMGQPPAAGSVVE